MTPEIAKATLEFLLRVTLRGQEVPAFNLVIAALEVEASKQPEGTPEDARGSLWVP